MTLAARIKAYETGDMPDEQVPELFQELVNTGKIWNMPGHFGRMAHKLLTEGIITKPLYNQENDGTMSHPKKGVTDRP
jgi:hypothetical protein